MNGGACDRLNSDGPAAPYDAPSAMFKTFSAEIAMNMYSAPAKALKLLCAEA